MARYAGVVALLGLLLAGATADMRVTLRVFSGTPDPTWTLQPAEVGQLQGQLASIQQVTTLGARRRVMGYSGFLLEDGRVVYGQPAAERWLLETARRNAQVTEAVRNHVLDVIQNYAADGFVAQGAREYGTRKVGSYNCSAGVVGPDTPPHYNPQTDDYGCFVTMQAENNCYDYGNDIVTNTFAQPGRGTGHKWVSNNCTDMRRASESDGLVWIGTTLPSSQPSKGHNVAMLIWPDTNFHWIRQDDNLFWSHKPGGTEVRNVDDDGKKIWDPSKANFSPWTQFCGYFVTVPSNVTIN